MTNVVQFPQRQQQAASPRLANAINLMNEMKAENRLFVAEDRLNDLDTVREHMATAHHELQMLIANSDPVDAANLTALQRQLRLLTENLLLPTMMKAGNALKAARSSIPAKPSGDFKPYA